MRFDNASTVVYYCLIQMNIINLGILAHIYNRKNEMYNFSKRNVQFSRFFAPYKKAT